MSALKYIAVTLLVVDTALGAFLFGHYPAQTENLGALSVLTVQQGGTGWANIQANTLLTGNGTGRLATTSIGTGLSLVGGVLSASGGTVTSVTGTYPVLSSGGTAPVISLAFGTTTSNLWAGTQTFTNAPILSSLTGILKGNGASAVTAVTGTNNYYPRWSSNSFTGTSLSWDNGSELRIGTTTNYVGNSSRMFVWGGAQGANIDVMGDPLVSDQATMELESSTYPNTFKSVYLQYTNTGLGTSLGITNTELGKLVFQGDNALIYTAASVPLIFGTGGTENMRIASGGNVGIGTTSPFSNLSVSNTAQRSGTLPLFTVASTTNATLLTVLGNGNTGINTPVPDAPLSVFMNGLAPSTAVLSGTQIHLAGASPRFLFDSSGNALFTGRISSTTTGVDNPGAVGPNQAMFTVSAQGYNGTAFANVGTFGWRAVNGLTTTDMGATFVIALAPVGSVALVNTVTLLGNGQMLLQGAQAELGIATSTPYATLSIQSNVVASTTLAVKPQTNATANTIDIYSKTAALVDVVNNIGNMGIGSTSPYATLSVQGAGSTTGVNFQTTNSAQTPILTVLDKGNVGIGTTSPWRNVDVNGTVGMKGLTTSAGLQTGVLCISANNEVINDSVACLASSRRFKQDISPLSDADSLAEVMKLNPVSYKYTDAFNGALKDNPNYNGEQVGFIAEDVQAVDPRLIVLDDSKGIAPNTPYSVRYEQMTALLAGAIQEQEKKIRSFGNSVQDKWQDVLIALLLLYAVYNEVSKRKK